jgi:hypothetical protein
MPRSDVPTSLQPQVSLLGSIAKKVSADAAASPILAYLAQQGIVLADDVAKGVTVMSNYAIYSANAKISQDFREQRDVLMLPIVNGMTGSIQFLKGFYQPNYKPLGDWGITAATGGKITLPTTELEWQTLIGLMNTKNSSYIFPLISPLQQYLTLNSIVLADDITDIATAIVKNASMASAKTIAEDAHELVVTDWAEPLAHIRLIVAFLMKLYKGNTKKLGYYGITVVAAAKVKKTRNVKIPFGFTKLKQKGFLGGAFINTGTETLWIYKGKTATGTPIVLLAGAKMIIPKGYSSFCVTNSSATISAKLQVVPPKQVD